MSDFVMDEATYGPIRDLLARTSHDQELRGRLLANPIQSIAEETGISLPSEWHLKSGVDVDGTVVLEFAGDEIPDFMLETVSGGAPLSYTFPPLVIQYRP